MAAFWTSAVACGASNEATLTADDAGIEVDGSCSTCRSCKTDGDCAPSEVCARVRSGELNELRCIPSTDASDGGFDATLRDAAGDAATADRDANEAASVAVIVDTDASDASADRAAVSQAYAASALVPLAMDVRGSGIAALAGTLVGDREAVAVQCFRDDGTASSNPVVLGHTGIHAENASYAVLVVASKVSDRFAVVWRSAAKLGPYASSANLAIVTSECQLVGNPIEVVPMESNLDAGLPGPGGAVSTDVAIDDQGRIVVVTNAVESTPILKAYQRLHFFDATGTRTAPPLTSDLLSNPGALSVATNAITGDGVVFAGNGNPSDSVSYRRFTASGSWSDPAAVVAGTSFLQFFPYRRAFLAGSFRNGPFALYWAKDEGAEVVERLGTIDALDGGALHITELGRQSSTSQSPTDTLLDHVTSLRPWGDSLVTPRNLPTTGPARLFGGAGTVDPAGTRGPARTFLHPTDAFSVDDQGRLYRLEGNHAVRDGAL